MNELANAASPNYMVVAFFAVGTAIMGFLGWRFITGDAPVFRRFGIGLAWCSASFAVWAAIVAMRPDHLQPWTAIGVALFVPGIFFFLGAATSGWQARNRRLALLGAAAYLIVLFVLRTLVQPSEPGFSERGLIYFNAQPLVLLLYIVAFAGALAPAVYAVSRAMTLRWLSRTTLVCFNLVIMCGVVLLSSYDDDLQTYNGYLMGIVMLTLLGAYLRHKPS